MNQQTKEELFRFYKWQKVIKIIGNSMTTLTQTEISDKLKINTHSVYIMLYELERQGLIIRTQDRYMVNVALTSRGRLVWKALSEIENIIGMRI